MNFPGSFFLTEGDVAAVSSRLAEKGWLNSGELISSAGKPGEGNMNCVLRIRTDRRSFILKQSRPWVEKYSDIAAPWDRAVTEARFYSAVGGDQRMAPHLPKLLAFDPGDRLLMLEDLGDAPDFTALYPGSGEADDSVIRALTQFLVFLHSTFRHPVLSVPFQNSAMRSLNHEHIFSLPLRSHNGLALDEITPGLSSVARELQQNDSFCREVASAGKIYLDPSRGSCLLHGDYFPGSWLQTERGVFVIDPEFCFYGPPEWDLGVMLAHLYLANQPRRLLRLVDDVYVSGAPLDRKLASKFAGIEIMRRLIGVAQLPLVCTLDRKKELLQLSEWLVLGVSTR